jgi:hypothetical protein
MKPASWDKLPIEDKIDLGNNLLRSYRGSYLLAQALYEAINVMKKKPLKEREVSNIQDMEILLETCFTTFGGIFDTQKKMARK